MVTQAIRGVTAASSVRAAAAASTKAGGAFAAGGSLTMRRYDSWASTTLPSPT